MSHSALQASDRVVYAIVFKSREGGRIANVAALVAGGVNEEGHREVLGVDVVT
jgi:transposase-like protein